MAASFAAKVSRESAEIAQFVAATLQCQAVRRTGSLTGQMAKHGTHVASIVFGRHGSPVPGVAPGCTGLVIPVFSDGRRRLSQLDLSRAIEAAVDAGAHVINISGGQLTEIGEAEDWLDRAIRYCDDNNVLVIAAAGNDGCASGPGARD